MRIDAFVLEYKPQFRLYIISLSGNLIEKTFQRMF